MNIFDISIQEGRHLLEENGLIDILEKGQDIEIPPEWDDLARLYFLVREKKPFQILEFGSGYSTVVMAYALKQNWSEYQRLVKSKGISKHFEQPSLAAIETSQNWRDNTQLKLANAVLDDFVNISFSKATVSEYQGQLCHFYDTLPDIVPDFVYLDGPDPLTVQGSLHGLSFENPQRTVMSGDMLKYESTLLPGFFMIVDGRTNNARFLQRMFRRAYLVHHYPDADVTTFQMQENRLGKKNILGCEAYTLQNNICNTP